MGLKKKNEAFDNKMANSNLLSDANKSIEKIESTEAKKIKKLAMIGIKIDEDYKDLLESHFKEYRGTTLSSGIRELIFNYMRENKLI